MIIISHRWSHYANQWYTDPTQRGLLTGITISNKHSKIRLLSSYWPVPHAANQHSLSLHAHVVQYLQQHNPLRDSPDMDQHHPLTFIQDLIMRETDECDMRPPTASAEKSLSVSRVSPHATPLRRPASCNLLREVAAITNCAFLIDSSDRYQSHHNVRTDSLAISKY